jgi:hypothetical protein
MRKEHKAVKDSTLNIDVCHQPFNNACWSKRYKCTPISDLSRIPDEAGHS